ncbi:M23 family metallopeptidase [Candidatus Parcubacteria bacterium]|nr:MAG: M23 family metallopeptidase [Candidatus Parcubacteria bacterium]
MNKLIFALLAVGVLAGGFLVLNSNIYQEEQPTQSGEPENTDAMFVIEEETVTLEDGEAAVSSPPSAPPSQKSATQEQHSAPQIASTQGNPDEPPLKLKGIGVNFEDFKFTKENLQFNRLFVGYGFVIPAGQSASGQAKANPQPTFIVPLGTPVRSLVDGVVAAIPTLWSGDYSVQVTADGKMQRWAYEMEHIMNPTVAVGDRVTAGQIVGEVSTFYNGAPPGYGAVEIGILKGGQVPEHLCPFAYFDDSVREEMFEKMETLFQSWEDYIGDQTLYTDTQIPGCLTLEPIEG